MTTAFTRGLRRLFGIKSKQKRILAPYGSMVRPEIVTDFSSEIEIPEIVQEKSIKKKATKKKVKKKKATRKKVAKKKSLE